MSGVGDVIFGDDPKVEEADPVDLTPPEFKNIRDTVAGTIERLLSPGGVPQFPGATPEDINRFTAALSPEELSLLSQIGQTGAGAGGLTDAAKASLSQTIGGDFLNVANNPALQGAIDAATRPIMEFFNEQTLPQLKTQFSRAGQFVGPEGSSAFDREARLLARDASNQISRTAQSLALPFAEAERQRQETAALAAPAVDRAELDRLITTLQSVALPRLIEQAGIDQGLAEFNNRINVLLSALGIGTTATQSTPVVPGQAVNPGTEGILDDLIEAGGAAGAAAIFACWVAREVYGPSNPQWLDFRARLLFRAPARFVRLYLRHGPAWARTIRRFPILKRVLRPIMDRLWR